METPEKIGMMVLTGILRIRNKDRILDVMKGKSRLPGLHPEAEARDEYKFFM